MFKLLKTMVIFREWDPTRATKEQKLEADPEGSTGEQKGSGTSYHAPMKLQKGNIFDRAN